MSTNPKRDILASLARIGTALSSPTRIEFLELLAQSERTVEQLATMTGASVANTSQHLQRLRQAGLMAIYDGVTTIEEVVRETIMEEG